MYYYKMEEHRLAKEVRDPKHPVFQDMTITSRDDKIAFVDERNDGILTYLLDLWERWTDDVDSLKKDKWGNVQTNSLRAWLRKNDDRKIFNREICNYGFGYFMGTRRWIYDLNDGIHKGNACGDMYTDLVDELFYRTLVKCYKEEVADQEAHDPYIIASRRVLDYMDKYRCYPFSGNVGWTSGHKVIITSETDSRDYREACMSELETMIVNFEGLEQYVSQMATCTTFKY